MRHEICRYNPPTVVGERLLYNRACPKTAEHSLVDTNYLAVKFLFGGQFYLMGQCGVHWSLCFASEMVREREKSTLGNIVMQSGRRTQMA